MVLKRRCSPNGPERGLSFAVNGPQQRLLVTVYGPERPGVCCFDAVALLNWS